MKKIMFNDKYELTQAVLDGRKTMTRRIITCPKSFKGEWVAGFHVYKRQSDGAILEYPCMYDADERDFDGGQILPKYKVGEVVAIAQSYKDAGVSSLPEEDEEFGCYDFPAEQTNGWANKMFVRSDLMPHQIRITNVRVERLQDISDEDCIKELGLDYVSRNMGYGNAMSEWVYQFRWDDKMGRTRDYCHRKPKEVFSIMIDCICGKGTWELNPYVFAYEFELVK